MEVLDYQTYKALYDRSQVSLSTGSGLYNFINILGGINMITTIKKVFDNKDASEQDFKVAIIGKGMRVSTWDEKHFEHLVEGATVDIAIKSQKKGNKTFYNILTICPVIDSEDELKNEVKSGGFMPDSIRQMGQSYGNARTSAISLVVGLVQSKHLKTADEIDTAVDVYTDRFFKDSMEKMTQWIKDGGRIFVDDNGSPPEEEDDKPEPEEEKELTEEEMTKLAESNTDESTDDIPF